MFKWWDPLDLSSPPPPLNVFVVSSRISDGDQEEERAETQRKKKRRRTPVHEVKREARAPEKQSDRAGEEKNIPAERDQGRNTPSEFSKKTYCWIL